MKKYSVIIMSVDPYNNYEDNHQKYVLTVEANEADTAKKIGIERFKKSHMDCPIFYTQVIEMD